MNYHTVSYQAANAPQTDATDNITTLLRNRCVDSNNKTGVQRY